MKEKQNRQSYGASNCGRNCVKNCGKNCVSAKYDRYGEAADCERSYSSAATNGINKYDSEFTDTKTTV